MSPEGEQRVHVSGRTLRVSNLDKVLYPASGTTKGEVLQYYAQIAPALLPWLRDRPVTRIRWPHGVERSHFFEKNLPSGAPGWLPSVVVEGHGSRSEHGSVCYPLIPDLAALTYLCNLASLELHIPQWKLTAGKEPKPDSPHRLVIDLDPGEGAGLQECAVVATLVRKHMQEVGLDPIAVTSGSKGIQLYAAWPSDHDANQAIEFARKLAQHLAGAEPDLVVWKMTKSLRQGKVFIDWSQNNPAKTTISPYSLRGRTRPTVAAPRDWTTIDRAASGQDTLRQLSMHEVLASTEQPKAPPEMGEAFD